MADKRDPLVLSNYIFELLEVNPGIAGFFIQLHSEDVDAVLESVTAHAEKGVGTKTTLCVGQEEEEEEEWEREWYGVTTPNILSGRGDSFSIWGNTPPYWGGGGGGCRRALGGLQ